MQHGLLFEFATYFGSSLEAGSTCEYTLCDPAPGLKAEEGQKIGGGRQRVNPPEIEASAPSVLCPHPPAMDSPSPGDLLASQHLAEGEEPVRLSVHQPTQQLTPSRRDSGNSSSTPTQTTTPTKALTSGTTASSSRTAPACQSRYVHSSTHHHNN